MGRVDLLTKRFNIKRVLDWAKVCFGLGDYGSGLDFWVD